MRLENIITFLETEKLNFTFSQNGLTFLSLRRPGGKRTANINKIEKGEEPLDDQTKRIIEETSNFLDTGRHGMKLDLSALSDFQRAVLNEVQKIAPGQLSTYKKLAEALGKPGAAQAVASAMTKNPVIYFIPTFRVLPQKGVILCRTGAGHLREKLLMHEGHDLKKIGSGLVCPGKNCAKHGW